MPFAAKHLPTFEMLVDNIGASPRAISKYLGVSERTVFAWKAGRTVPKATLLALFWESSWGRSLHHTTLENGRQYQQAHVASLQREIARLNAQIARVNNLSDTANAPVFRQA